MSIFRVSWTSLLLGLLLLGITSQSSASMNAELLRADFNDKPLNVQIGTGGASVGEPVSVPADLDARVRAAPFPTPSLHFLATTAAASYARFDFVNGEEILSGELRISFTVRTPSVADQFRVGIRDQLTATAVFSGLDFRTDGTIFTVETPTAIGSYSSNEDLHFEFVYQVVAGTYDLFINGIQKFDDRLQGTAELEKGIGALFFGFPAGTSSQEWIVDDIHVVRTPGLLNADFNDKPVSVRIGTGGAAVGEPIDISNLLTADVDTGHFATSALRLEQSMTGSSKAARFEFLNSREITAGELRISYRLLTAPVTDSFLSYLREQGSSASKFGGLRFESNGNITALDDNGSIATTGSYMPGDTLLVESRYALAAGTYDVYINRVLVLDDRAHGVPEIDRGIGRLILSTNSPTTSLWVFDDLYVYQPGVLFQDGFD